MKTGIVSALCYAAIGSMVLGCNTAGVVEAKRSLNRDPRFTCVSAEPVTPLPSELRATLVAFGTRHPDDEYVAMSSEVPGGFGGLFVESERTVLLFVDPVAGLASRAELQSRLSARGLDYSRLHLETAEVRPARWTFAQLDEWFRYIVPRLRVDGLNSWDIDERANTISLGVVDEAAQVRVEAAIADLNIPCNLVTTRVQGQIYAL